MTTEQLKDLRDAIDASLRGEVVQAKWIGGENEEWIDAPAPNFNNTNRLLYRPKPAPKTRPWSKPEDVPGPVCWIRWGERNTQFLITRIAKDFIGVDNDARIKWKDISRQTISLGEAQYSTDRKTWSECTVTEP